MQVDEYKVKMEKYHKVVTNLRAENSKLSVGEKENSSNSDLRDKLKKAQADLRSKVKDCEDAKKEIKLTECKLTAEVNARSKAESENVRSVKLLDHLQESLDKLKSSDDNKKLVKNCEYFIRMGQCQLGKECKDNHNTKERAAFLSKKEVMVDRVRTTKDCHFWMKGDCRFPGGRECSRGTHDAEKFGVNRDSSFLYGSSMMDPRSNSIIERSSMRPPVAYNRGGGGVHRHQGAVWRGGAVLPHQRPSHQQLHRQASPVWIQVQSDFLQSGNPATAMSAMQGVPMAGMNNTQAVPMANLSNTQALPMVNNTPGYRMTDPMVQPTFRGQEMMDTSAGWSGEMRGGPNQVQ